MLVIAKVTRGAAGGYAEYLEGRTQATGLGDYYLKDGERVEAPGRWVQGAGAVGCDPDAAVTGEQLRTLMAVRRPDTGAELRRAGGNGEAVAALDATFSAPKSVSAIWAVSHPGLRAQVERAHERAIDQALDYSVGQAAMIRQRLNQETVIHVKAVGLVATSWRHTTARAVQGQAPDPQLHSHVLLHAAVRRDGRLVAIDSRSWFVHQREIGAAYRSELARGLHELGFEVQRGTGRGGRYFEIAGVPAGLIDRWSSRHHQVQQAIRQRLAQQRDSLERMVAAGGPDARDAAGRLELLDRYGQLAPREERSMSTSTRSAKAPVTVADLDREWQRTATTHQLDCASVELLREPRPALVPATAQQLLDGLTEFDATFPARDARAVALEHSAGAPVPDTLTALAELRSSTEILMLADGTATTREHRRRERSTVAVGEQLAAGSVPALPERVIAGQTERLDRELSARGGRLSLEQREAIMLGCSDQQLVIIEGQAGTGKSTTLTGIARAHEQCGRELVVTSTAAVAAERVAEDLQAAGVQTSAYSTAALHAAVHAGRIELGPDTTIIHDEAALASTREQHQLLADVQDAGARLIMVGDGQQNQPVGSGGLWRHLEGSVADVGGRIELTANQRAQDPNDRGDQALFRAGEHEPALRAYGARDRIHLHDRQDQAENAALDAAHADRTAGKHTIVIAQTSNEQLDALNARAQALRLHDGQLGKDSIP
ncbi:MAG: MobF family relaxase, partial [Solirubrobacteraceae bacterium]